MLEDIKMTNLPRYTSRTLLILISIILFNIQCIIDPDSGNDVKNTRYSASESFSYKIGYENQTLLKVVAINGSIEIVGVAQLDSIEIWGERRVKSESIEDAELHLPLLQVVVSEDNEKILVQTEQPVHSGGRSYEVEYYIRIPDSWRVEAGQINGRINIREVRQSVDASQTNGEIELNSVKGSVNTSQTNGTVTLVDVEGNVRGVLTNGNICGKVNIPQAGSCELKTTNGMITLSIPQSTSADLLARVVNGKITVHNLILQNSTSTPHSLSGTIGQGDGNIDLATVNGNIVLDGF
jgi:hypothetical protein